MTDQLEVMLISSRETRRWVLPKGWPMKGRKPHAAAAREALEEAGVVGKIGKVAVGSYRYIKRMKNGAQQLCDVTVFPLVVQRQRKHWPERHQRSTRWFSLEDAAEAVGEPDLREVIRNFALLPRSGPSRTLNRSPCGDVRLNGTASDLSAINELGRVTEGATDAVRAAHNPIYIDRMARKELQKLVAGFPRCCSMGHARYSGNIFRQRLAGSSCCYRLGTSASDEA